MDAVSMDLSNALGGRAGMHYTALSRVRTPEGLYFQKSTGKAVKAGSRHVSAFAGQHITTVAEEMERLRRDGQSALQCSSCTYRCLWKRDGQ